MTNKTDEHEQKPPVFQIVDGNLVRKPDDVRDPKRRYAYVASSEGTYLREFTDEQERQRDEEEARWAEDAPQRALEKERQQKEADKFRESLTYENRLVAFIDILGWTSVVRTSPEDREKTQKLGLALNTIRGLTQQSEWMENNSDTNGWPGDPKITQFSDCLIISTRDDFYGKTHLINTLGFLSMSLLHQGLLLRGGLTIGKLYHQESMVFGPALLKAHELESRSAVYPRIIIELVLSERWGQGDVLYEKNGSIIGYAKTWRLSHDGFRFFDFLQPFGGTPFLSHSRRLFRHTLLPLRSLLIENLEKYVSHVNYFVRFVLPALTH